MANTENFKSDSPTIAEFLKIQEGQQFVIPEYQRKYSWEKEQCEQLYNDLKNYIDDHNNNELYFFGTIIIAPSEEDSNKLNLIDGQQRTTTFLLLLKALQLKISEIIPEMPDDIASDQLKFELGEKNKKIMKILFGANDADMYKIQRNWEYVKQLNPILINKSINEQYANDFQNIINGETFESICKNPTKIKGKYKENKFTNFFRNFKYFYEKLQEDLKESKLNIFADRFLEKCQIIRIKSMGFEQAITMFNSLNSTGLPLTDADIISAKLYSHAKSETFKDDWRDLLNSIASDTKNTISLNFILQQYMYIYRAQKEPTISSSMPALRDFYTSIKQHSELLNDPSELCKRLNAIVQIWLKVSDNPTVKLLLKFNENIKLFFISFLSRFSNNDKAQESNFIVPEDNDIVPEDNNIVPEDDFIDMAKCLIRLFTIYELIEAPYSDSRFKQFLFRENAKIVDKNKDVSEIVADFSEHIKIYWKRDVLKDELLDYDSTNPVLVFLNEYLYAEEKGKGKEFAFSDDVNIEHIMPNSGRKQKYIQKEANIESSEIFNSYVNKLGNRILLEENINKSLGNETWFQCKKDNSISGKGYKGYKDSKYFIARALVKYPRNVWTKEDIDIATEKAANRILKFIFDEK